MMKSAGSWWLLLLAVCMVGPYVLGVRPRTSREWTYIALTIAFITIVLIMGTAISR
jgi:hypothetical protein